ncbi:TRAP transporter small permease [Pelagibius litoralis]|nr:TRAP transporter small permease [Pelagibius litoralis]
MPGTPPGSNRNPAAPAALVGRWARRALGVLLIAMVLLNVANALSRYVLGQAIEGSDELLVFGMVWVVFLGAAFVTLDRRHLSFDVVSRALRPRLRGFVRVAGDLIMIVLLGFVALQSFEVVGRLAALGQRSMAAAIPTYIPHSAILVGFGLSSLVLLLALLRQAATLRTAPAGRDEPGQGGEGP